jgi:peptide/nickel transport system permease protein
MLIPLLLGVTLLTFSLTKALPGDPVLNMVGERAQIEVIEKIRKDEHVPLVVEVGSDFG